MRSARDHNLDFVNKTEVSYNTDLTPQPTCDFISFIIYVFPFQRKISK